MLGYLHFMQKKILCLTIKKRELTEKLLVLFCVRAVKRCVNGVKKSEKVRKMPSYLSEVAFLFDCENLSYCSRK